MASKKCSACGHIFQPRPQVIDQSYCSSPSCQRERRRRWQKTKLQFDPDYQDNQARAQQAWSQRNPDYWREYRKSHPKYAERNRVLQHERNKKHMAEKIANMDLSDRLNLLPSGIYNLSLVTDDRIANMDVWTVEITVHSCQYKSKAKIAKR